MDELDAEVHEFLRVVLDSAMPWIAEDLLRAFNDETSQNEEPTPFPDARTQRDLALSTLWNQTVLIHAMHDDMRDVVEPYFLKDDGDGGLTASPLYSNEAEAQAAIEIINLIVDKLSDSWGVPHPDLHVHTPVRSISTDNDRIDESEEFMSFKASIDTNLTDDERKRLNEELGQRETQQEETDDDPNKPGGGYK